MLWLYMLSLNLDISDCEKRALCVYVTDVQLSASGNSAHV